MKSKDFIKGYYLEDMSVCDRFIEYFNKNKGEQRKGITYTGKQIINPLNKDSTDISLNIVDDVNKCDVVKDYEKELLIASDKYIKDFPMVNSNSGWGITENFNLQKYNPGQGFHVWHCERAQTNSDRMLVFMTYLNDVTDGGETEFFFQKYKIQPRKGLTLLWPTDWTYTHRGNVSMSQEKYIATGWFSYV